MATASDLMVRARRRLGVHADEEPYEAHQQTADFQALTDMLRTWDMEGTIKSFTAASVSGTVTLTFQDDTTLTDEANEAIAANLAIRLSDDYSIAVPATVARDAVVAKDAISKKQALAHQPAQSSYDAALGYMPSQRLGTFEAYDGSA